MKLIIDIPEDEVNECKMQVDMIKQEGFLVESLNTALKIHVANGTPLPKGHGKIGDLDAVMSDICASINEMTSLGIMVDGEYLWGKLNDAIDNAQPIIEADKAESMTKQEIIKEINKCQYRHTGLGDKYAICPLCCEPCIEAVNRGKCKILKELFENSEEMYEKSNN